MTLVRRITCLSSLCLLAALCPGQSRPAVPAHLPVSQLVDAPEPSPTVEAPALYPLLRQVASLPPPAQSQGLPCDRKTLLAQPEPFVGGLLTIQARYRDSDQIRLKNASDDGPALAWSILAVDPEGQPIQVLTLGQRPQFGKMDRVRCIGYFYKIRLDQSQAAQRTSRRTGAPASAPAVQVPVLVGWVLPDTSQPPRPHTWPAWQTMGTVVAGVLVLFFFAWSMSRRRTDWRTRVAQHRRHRDRHDPSEGNHL